MIPKNRRKTWKGPKKKSRLNSAEASRQSPNIPNTGAYIALIHVYTVEFICVYNDFRGKVSTQLDVLHKPTGGRQFWVAYLGFQGVHSEWSRRAGWFFLFMVDFESQRSNHVRDGPRLSVVLQ